MFAASLQAVDSGTAAPDYTDAERFFTKTYMTRSLESVLEGGVGAPDGSAHRRCAGATVRDALWRG